ncbi:MAG: InlB B-repeat-containing protein, partial [Erysipelotrichaceae bacterium]|nr:InlB B-repeat-containing protein [Erysipelotrichaceae bacterium]
VIFHDQYSDEINDFPIASTRRDVPSGESNTVRIRIDDVTDTFSGNEELGFYGWSYTPISVPGSATDDNGDPVSKIGENTPEGESIYVEISEDTHLYPIYKSIRWLSYWSGPTGSGATYFPAESYFGGVGPSSLPVPARAGYVFKGWYAGTIDDQGNVTYGSVALSDEYGNLKNGASDGGMTVYDGKLHLSRDATLYAKWEGGETATYKIIIWRQKTTAAAGNQNKDNYDFFESHIKSAAIGTDATIDAAYKEYATSKPDEFADYTCSYDPDVEVNPSGYTVLNVYYDRAGEYTPSEKGHSLTFINTATNPNTKIVEYNNVAYRTSILTGNSGGSFVPVSPTRKNYSFTGWFADVNCTTQVFFSSEEYDSYTGYNQKVFYDEMPDYNLTIYTGWEAEWYIVQIDPNYGSFNGSGSTWFWKTVESDLIQEYTQVTRDYVESSSGSYYYVKHDRAYYGYSGNEWDNSEPDRDAYYTVNPGEATDYKTFEYAPGIYSYAGWYEVHEDGSETLFDFSQHVDHNITLKLHWKKAGEFYVRYYTEEGLSIDNTNLNILNDPTVYADNAEIIISHGATAPENLAFVGWKVQGDDSGKLYRQGEVFILQSDYAVAISGKDTVTLEAVYKKLDTASIIYDPNGGTIDPNTFDYGHPELNNQFIGHMNEGNTAVVLNIYNNTNFYLSNGTGISKNGAVLVGWSNKQVYDPNDKTAALYTLGGLYGVDTNEPKTVYAVWQEKVTYHLVSGGIAPSDLSWGGDWTGYADETIGTESVKTKTLYSGNATSEPADIPQYTGTGSYMFFTWTTDPNAQTITSYDFSQPVTEKLDLYAYWRGPIEVPVHAIDASGATLSLKDTWLAQNAKIPVLTSEVAINSTLAATYVTGLPSDYEYAFAVVLERNTTSTRSNVYESNAVSSIKYNQEAKHLYVKYADTSKGSVALDESYEIYFVYYQKKTLSILYKGMPSTGELTNITTTISSSAPTATNVKLGDYVMASQVTRPKAWNSDTTYTHYAYAIGNASATNASGLQLITASSDSDSSLPTLEIKNTWQGFYYSTDSGEKKTWTSCGYSPALFVVYYKQLPTIVIFKEKTVGIKDVMDTEFEFNLKIDETVKVTEETIIEKWIEPDQEHGEQGHWERVSDTSSESQSTGTIFDTRAAGNSPYRIKNDEGNTAILFYSNTSTDSGWSEYQTDEIKYRKKTITTRLATQKATIEQTANTDFTTSLSVNGEAQTGSPYVYTHSSDASGSSITAVFTNTDKKHTVQVHVARIENGTIKLRDSVPYTSRSYEQQLYLENIQYTDIQSVLPANEVYRDNTGIYALGAVCYGTNDSEGNVSIVNMDVTSVSYGPVSNGEYDIILKDSDNNVIPLNGYSIYYLYYPMPRIQYIKQEGSTLSLIRGSTDGINPSDQVTYDKKIIEMNDMTVVQNQRISFPLSG